MKDHKNVQRYEKSKNLTMGFISYTCTNHPDVILNEPGKCPRCGKDLVTKF